MLEHERTQVINSNAKLTVQEAFDDYTKFLSLVHERLPGADRQPPFDDQSLVRWCSRRMWHHRIAMISRL